MADMPEVKVTPNPRKELKEEQDRKSNLEQLQELKVLSKRQARMADLLIDPPENKSMNLLSKSLNKGFESLAGAAEGLIGQVPFLGAGIISLTKGTANLIKERKEQKQQALKEQREKELELAEKIKAERLEDIKTAQEQSKETGESVEKILEVMMAEKAEKAEQLKLNEKQQQELLRKLEQQDTTLKNKNNLSTQSKKILTGIWLGVTAIGATVKKLFTTYLASFALSLLKIGVISVAIVGVIKGIERLNQFIRDIDFVGTIIRKIDELKETFTNVKRWIEDIGIGFSRNIEDLKMNVGNWFQILGANFDILVQKVVGAVNPFGDNTFKINQAEKRKERLLEQQEKRKLQIADERAKSDEAKMNERLQQDAYRKALMEYEDNKPNNNSVISTNISKSNTSINAPQRNAGRVSRSPKLPASMPLGGLRG